MSLLKKILPNSCTVSNYSYIYDAMKVTNALPIFYYYFCNIEAGKFLLKP